MPCHFVSRTRPTARGYSRTCSTAAPMIRLFAAFVICAQAAGAEGLDIKFRDGAPGDMFHVINMGCPVIQSALTFDLTTSAGGVVIDTAYGGIGTQDPRNVEIIAGSAALVPVNDGDQTLTLLLDLLPTGAGVVVSFDVDDTISDNRGNRVSVAGSEIAGATVTLAAPEASATATFDANGNTLLTPPQALAPCLSS